MDNFEDAMDTLPTNTRSTKQAKKCSNSRTTGGARLEDSETDSPDTKQPKLANQIAELIQSIQATNEQVKSYLTEKSGSMDNGIALLLSLMMNQTATCALLLQQQNASMPVQAEKIPQPAFNNQIDAEEKERRRSIVISGLPEPQGIPSVRAKEDSGSVVKLLDEIDAEATICSCYRLGARKTGANRLVKVVFSTSQQQKQVLRNAKKLKNSIQFKKIVLRPSLTLEQRQRESQLWEECKKLREDPKNRGKVKIVGGPPGHPNRKVVIDSGNQ